MTKLRSFDDSTSKGVRPFVALRTLRLLRWTETTLPRFSAALVLLICYNRAVKL